ncbi:hypothetical protein [Paludibaculum fermentans]|uniref:hypothetical protein n=1 Tax=Paludibaculum fermentans TaxID=1473598 RepID=UPI003EBEAA0D
MFHPFQLVPRHIRPRLMWPAALLACGLALILTWQGFELKSKSAPQGIVSLELAASAKTAQTILEEWRGDHPGISMEDNLDKMVQQVPKGKDELALRLIMLDFVFLLAYAAALSMSCVWLARRSGLPALGVGLGWAIWLAALLDALENTLLLRLMNGSLENSTALAACLCALVKFALFLAALGFTGFALWKAGRKVLGGFFGLVWIGTFFSVAAALLR